MSDDLEPGALKAVASWLKVRPSKTIDGIVYLSTDTCMAVVREVGLEDIVTGSKLAHYRTRKAYAGVGPEWAKIGGQVFYPETVFRAWCNRVKADGAPAGKPGKGSRNYGTGSSKERKQGKRGPSFRRMLEMLDGEGGGVDDL